MAGVCVDGSNPYKKRRTETEPTPEPVTSSVVLPQEFFHDVCEKGWLSPKDRYRLASTCKALYSPQRDVCVLWPFFKNDQQAIQRLRQPHGTVDPFLPFLRGMMPGFCPSVYTRACLPDMGALPAVPSYAGSLPFRGHAQSLCYMPDAQHLWFAHGESLFLCIYNEEIRTWLIKREVSYEWATLRITSSGTCVLFDRNTGQTSVSQKALSTEPPVFQVVEGIVPGEKKSLLSVASISDTCIVLCFQDNRVHLAEQDSRGVWKGVSKEGFSCPVVQHVMDEDTFVITYFRPSVVSVWKRTDSGTWCESVLPETETGEFFCATFLPDKRLVTLGNRKTLRLWFCDKGVWREQKEFLIVMKSDISGIKTTAHGNVLVWSHMEGHFYSLKPTLGGLWDIHKHNVTTFHEPFEMMSVHVSANNNILIHDYKGRISLWQENSAGISCVGMLREESQSDAGTIVTVDGARQGVVWSLMESQHVWLNPSDT